MRSLRVAGPAPARGRLPALDELKGVAILLIILYHAGGILHWNNTLHGDAGVDIFVVLSGLGLALSPGGEPAGRFLARRFRRIYPAYWIVLTAVVGARARFLGDHYTAPDLALHYLGIHGWFGDRYATSISDPFWFITLIVTLYLVFLAVRPLLGRADLLLLAGAVLSLVPAVLLYRAGEMSEFGHEAMRLPGFFAGLLAGRLLRAGELEVPLTPALALALVGFFYLPYVFNFLFATTLLGIALIAAYLLAVRPFVAAATQGALAFLGRHSLELFLVHQPLIRECNLYVLLRSCPQAGLAPGVVVTGMVVWLGVALALSVGLHRLLRGLSGGAPRPAAAA